MDRIVDEIEDRRPELVGVAQKLWDKVRGKTKDTDDAPVVDLFEQRPDQMQSALEDVVRQLLEKDEAFRSEVTELLEEETDGTPTWKLMGEYVGVVNMQHANVSGSAQVGGVIVNSPSPKEPAE